MEDTASDDATLTAERLWEIESAPAELDAGSEVALKLHLTPPEDAQIEGRTLTLHDAEGEEIGSTVLGPPGDDGRATAEFAFQAPEETGTLKLTAALSDREGRETELPLTLTVVPHATRVLVWDIPSAVPEGEAFAVTVGVKCSSVCDLSGHPVEIRDGEGRVMGQANLGETPKPGTSNLYCTQVELAAPLRQGLQHWSVAAPAAERMPEHAEGGTSFGVSVVAPPDVTLRVEVADSKTGEPLPRANVVLHPYRAVADENGVAEIRVTRGEHNIFVSAPGYYPVRRVAELTEDFSTRAELEKEPPPPPW